MLLVEDAVLEEGGTAVAIAVAVALTDSDTFTAVSSATLLTDGLGMGAVDTALAAVALDSLGPSEWNGLLLEDDTAGMCAGSATAACLLCGGANIEKYGAVAGATAALAVLESALTFALLLLLL